MKKQLTRSLLLAFATISVFFALTTSSCLRDKCKTVVCANGGVCTGGNCTCPTGYEGTNCETVSTAKFTGNWQVHEKSSITEAAQYGTVITTNPNPSLINYVQIYNFWNWFTEPINAYVVNDTITIPNQNIQGHVIVGYGYIYYNVTYSQYANMNLYYKVVDTATNYVYDYGFYATDYSQASAWSK